MIEAFIDKELGNRKGDILVGESGIDSGNKDISTKLTQEIVILFLVSS